VCGLLVYSYIDWDKVANAAIAVAPHNSLLLSTQPVFSAGNSFAGCKDYYAKILPEKG